MEQQHQESLIHVALRHAVSSCEEHLLSEGSLDAADVCNALEAALEVHGVPNPRETDMDTWGDWLFHIDDALKERGIRVEGIDHDDVDE
jgi:hypothetical protein